MLGDVLCEPPKHWYLTSSSSISHYGCVSHRRHASGDTFPIKLASPATECVERFNFCESGVSASIWHDILPTGNDLGRYNRSIVGEGSWNVAWDVRPARWLHRPHTAWLLFGICAYLAAPPVELTETVSEPIVVDDDHDIINGVCTNTVLEKSSNYRVRGVPADGRCLFRAIAHMVCLRNGEEAPDENRQKELADELRVQVVNELMKRRNESEWFIEGDFDAYIKRIQKPFVWGGEPELIMASHVLKSMISVYMLEKDSNKLSKIATYGEEYENAENNSIKVLFHGYGHYDIVEDIF